jgi:hypothetical protein
VGRYKVVVQPLADQSVTVMTVMWPPDATAGRNGAVDRALPAVAKLRYMSVHEIRDAARRAFAERQQGTRT